jgi:hypothetical protein
VYPLHNHAYPLTDTGQAFGSNDGGLVNLVAMIITFAPQGGQAIRGLAGSFAENSVCGLIRSTNCRKPT